MGRHKKQRISIPKEGDAVSKKALKDSSIVVWGNEPNWVPVNQLLDSAEKHFETQRQLGLAFNWYYNMTDEKLRKSFFVDYAEKFFPNNVDNVRNISPDLFTCGEYHTYGVLARMIMRGWPIDQTKKEHLSSLIKTYNKNSAKIIEPQVEKKKDRDPVISKCINLVNEQLDDFGFVARKKFPEPSMADTVLKVGATNGQRTKVHEHFGNTILEIKQVITGDDELLKEAYSGVSKGTLQKVYNWFTAMPSEGLVVTQKTRKTRKKKVKSAAQILKLFICQKSDSELNVQSVDPETILGAQQLWVFNTKTRKLGVYYAANEKGLGVSRKSIDNYDEKTSFCKKIRKPKEIIPGVITAGKVALRHAMDEIRATKSPMKSRICETVLLLRTVK